MLNYHDLELKRTNGKLKIADIYIYVAGENFSSLLKDMYDHYRDELGDFSEGTSNNWETEVPKMRSLVSAGKHREAQDIYKTIPEKVKKAKILQITHLMICSGLSDEEYTDAVAEYESIYPNEPNMQLLMVDAYIVRKDYTKALNAVNELDKMIDKDPMLDYHRAMCYTMMKDDAKRLEYLEKVVKSLPDFEDGVLELIVDYLQLKEFEKARPLIERFKSRSSFDQTTLNYLLIQYPGYNEKYGND
jgi:tetratricopeptide (TPR) repeat protein